MDSAAANRTLDRAPLVSVAIGLIALIALNTVGLYTVFTSRGQFVIWDIQPIRTGAQAVLQGQDPYSPEVTRQIQLEAYGRLPRPGEDVHAFAYPLYVAYLAIPLAALPNAWAQALWLTLLELAAVAGIAVCGSVWGWPQTRLRRAGLLVFCLAFYPLVWSFVLGQLAIPAFALLAISAWAILHGREGLAGFALALTAIKPQVSLLVIPAWGLWGAIHGRWRMLGALAATLGVFVLVPTMVQPSWIASFIARVGEYANYSPFTPPTVVLAESCCPSLAAWLGPAMSGTFLILMVFGWWQAARSDAANQFLWASGATLIATMAVGPETALVNQVVLLIPLFGLLRLVLDSSRSGRWLGLALAVLWAAGPWILSWLPPVATAPTPRFAVEHRVISPFMPFTLGAAWIVYRSRLMRWIQPTQQNVDGRG